MHKTLDLTLPNVPDEWSTMAVLLVHAQTLSGAFVLGVHCMVI